MQRKNKMTREVRTVRYALAEDIDEKRREGGALHAVQYRDNSEWKTITPELEVHLGIPFYSSRYLGDFKWKKREEVASTGNLSQCLALAGAKIIEKGIHLLLYEVTGLAYRQSFGARPGHFRGMANGEGITNGVPIETLYTQSIELDSKERKELWKIEFCPFGGECPSHHSTYYKAWQMYQQWYSHGDGAKINDFITKRKIKDKAGIPGDPGSSISMPFAITSTISDESFERLRQFLGEMEKRQK